MKHAIISGATSMLGIALTEACAKQGVAVTAIVREGSTKTHLLPASVHVRVVECDLANLSRWTIDKVGDDAVFYHFAWAATDQKSRWIADAQTPNIGFTLDAVRAAKRIGCKRFVGAGSQAEYGRVNGTIARDRAVSPDSAYGVCKYAAGRLAGVLCEELGLDFIWTRVFSLYGPYDAPTTLIQYCINTLLQGKMPLLTSCEQQWDYLHCTDAAQAFLRIGEKGRKNTLYNIASGEARPLRDYVDCLRDQIDPLLPLGIGSKAYEPQQVMYLRGDISNLTEDTGFVPTIPFDKGIASTIRFARENK